MLGEEAAVVVVEAALELAVKAAKSPLDKIIHRWAGKKVLIVGPRDTGKTSFANYLRFGILADEETRVLSEEEEVFSTFSVETAKGQRLSARFRYVRAMPGELHIVKHDCEILAIVPPPASVHDKWAA